MSKIAVGKNLENGYLDIFAIGPDNYIYYKRREQNGDWDNWKIFADETRELNKGSIGGDYRAKDLALISTKGKMELFMIGINDNIYNCHIDKKNPLAWTRWKKLSLPLNDKYSGLIDRKKDLKVLNVSREGENPKNALELFYIYSNDGVFNHRRKASGWTQGIQQAVPVKKYAIANHSYEPGITYDNDLEIVTISSKSGSEFGKVSIQPSTRPNIQFHYKKGINVALDKNKDGRLELFVIGDRNNTGEVNQIWHFWQNNTYEWQEELDAEYFDGKTALDFILGINKPSSDVRLELFTIGTNNTIYHFYQKSPNSEWSSELILGTKNNKAKEIAVGTTPDGGLEVFTIGIDDEVYLFSRGPDSGDWTKEQSLELNPYITDNIQSIW